MYANYNVLAIVPARAGSKGVKAKNIRPLHGKPLISWVIEAAKGSRHIDRVIVSTDGEDIAAAARSAGADVPFMRPAHLAEDQTPDAPVFEHALEWLRDHEGYEPDIVVHLRPTGPLVLSHELDEAIELLANNPDAHSVRSMQTPNKTPHKMWRAEAGSPYMVPFMRDIPLPEALREKFKDWHTAPRQALPAVHETTADIGVVWRRVVQNLHSVIGEKVLPYQLNRPTVDIDTMDDFEIAEMWLMKRR